MGFVAHSADMQAIYQRWLNAYGFTKLHVSKHNLRNIRAEDEEWQRAIWKQQRKSLPGLGQAFSLFFIRSLEVNRFPVGLTIRLLSSGALGQDLLGILRQFLGFG